MQENYQIETWASDFGADYTDRNIYNPEELNLYYSSLIGIKRSEMNVYFLDDLHLTDKRILEVGCNVGNQLRLLQQQGYKNLWGLELQNYAVEKAKELTKGINIIQGIGDDIPFKDGYFDLVFTSGVLIHINPNQVQKIIKEIYRCTSTYIWGYEYYADKYTGINYRGQDNLLWKTDFAKLYQEICPDLILLKQEKYKYLENDNVDSMFLLQKKDRIK